MHYNQILQKTVAANNNWDQVTQSEAKNEQTQTHELAIPDLAIFLYPVGFMVGWIFFFLILRKIRALLDEKIIFSISHLHKVPCKNCRFYSSNYYLKCAVNPSVVLTEEAKNCSEYSPNKKNFSSKNPLD
ncbi:hypothetical protein H6G97_22180 [Nostoc flagelliforme FACHB-838]|uniref:Uncharacterized protein n=1 Tax=Nostoc flagelliforme FACHB-838 TaxID=2692904 RepID=A0ABR8DRR6_9NOSO|nr:hypothetical protein [Nostoc flagelliforme]MBD2532141.1 hypothetical protein [Nostoc flagelliforme FACHB-838]